jgi:hypothetical protein
MHFDNNCETILFSNIYIYICMYIHYSDLIISMGT